MQTKRSDIVLKIPAMGLNLQYQKKNRIKNKTDTQAIPHPVKALRQVIESVLPPTRHAWNGLVLFGLSILHEDRDHDQVHYEELKVIGNIPRPSETFVTKFARVNVAHKSDNWEYCVNAS